MFDWAVARGAAQAFGIAGFGGGIAGVCHGVPLSDRDGGALFYSATITPKRRARAAA